MKKPPRRTDSARGFASIELILAIIVLLGIAVAGYLTYQSVHKTTSVATAPISLSSWNKWNTKCAYSFSHPKDWHVSETYDATTLCTVVIFAPDGEGYQTMDESGLIVTITQDKKGYQTWNFPPPTYQRVNYTVNSPDDDIKQATDMASEDNVVTLPIELNYGQLSGKYVLSTVSSNPGVKTYDGTYSFA